MTEIGEESKFVTCILQDTKGSKIKNIRNIIRQTGGGVMDEVFNNWLVGKGKLPITWQTLIYCLKVARLNDLVEVIGKEMGVPKKEIWKEMGAGSFFDSANSLIARYGYS